MGKKDIVDHAYVRNKSKAWYKLRNWFCTPFPESGERAGYSTFGLTVESRLKIIRELELLKLMIKRLETKAKIEEQERLEQKPLYRTEILHERIERLEQLIKR